MIPPHSGIMQGTNTSGQESREPSWNAASLGPRVAQHQGASFTQLSLGALSGVFALASLHSAAAPAFCLSAQLQPFPERPRGIRDCTLPIFPELIQASSSKTAPLLPPVFTRHGFTCSSSQQTFIQSILGDRPLAWQFHLLFICPSSLTTLQFVHIPLIMWYLWSTCSTPDTEAVYIDHSGNLFSNPVKL